MRPLPAVVYGAKGYAAPFVEQAIHHLHAHNARPRCNIRPPERLVLLLTVVLALTACQHEPASAANSGAGNATANGGDTLDENRLSPVTRSDVADPDTGKRACPDFADIGRELNSDPAQNPFHISVPLLSAEAFAQVFGCKVVRDGDGRIRIR